MIIWLGVNQFFSYSYPDAILNFWNGHAYAHIAPKLLSVAISQDCLLARMMEEKYIFLISSEDLNTLSHFLQPTFVDVHYFYHCIST